MKILISHNGGDAMFAREFPEGQEIITIGRGEDNDVVLSDMGVSRHHARIVLDSGFHYIEDSGSRSGVKLNGAPIGRRMALEDGNVIWIGDFRLRVSEFSGGNADGRVADSSSDSISGAPTSASPMDDIEVERLQVMPDFLEVQGLYNQETMVLKGKIHSLILEKLNLPETALKDFANAELVEKLEDSLDQTLRELRHELPSNVPLSLLRQAMLDELVGYGPISPMLRSAKISEIMINGPDHIFVESKGKIYKTGVRFMNEQHLISILQRIVEPLGRHVDAASPMVDARLPDGSRVNAIIPPLAIHGTSITIRKFAEKKLTIEDLIGYDSLTKEMGLFLREAVRSRQNILVSGGTGSGKTTLLNILSQFIPEIERVITIEDSAELKLSHENIVSLEARPANIEGTGKVTIRDLVVNTLRMRPDRIIVGECRGAEALDMLQAMNTGHDGSLTTCHANNPRDALSRLENMVMMAGFELPSAVIREQIASAINIIVQQSRFPDGTRKIVKISEVTGRERDVILLQDIFVYNVKGFDSTGKHIVGDFTPTGNIPRFVETLRESGKLRLDMGVFVPKV